MLSRVAPASCGLRGSWQCAPTMLQQQRHAQHAGCPASSRLLCFPAACHKSQRCWKVVAAGVTGTGDAEASPTGAASTRRRRKLFSIDALSLSDVASNSDSTALQQQQQLEVPQELTTPRRRRRPTTYSKLPQQQQQQQDEPVQQHEPGQQQQEQGASHADRQLRWWQHPSAASTLLTHTFWDLDNVKPGHWNQAPDLVQSLKSALEPFGRLQQLQGYANGNTLVRHVEAWGLEEEFFEEEDDTRCPICGRRCKSFEDLQKHFRQLHEREHKKKLGGPKKFVKKYVKSDKAARVRDAGRLYGTPKKDRAGRAGQLVRAVLQKAGVNVYEVASQKQAADEAINRHLDRLLDKLQTSQPQPPSLQAAVTAAGAAAAAGNDPEALRRKWKLWLELAELPSARDCLTEMLSMSEDELKSAWKYLRRVGAVVPKEKGMWSSFWRDIQSARADNSSRVTTPGWLNLAWHDYHLNPDTLALHKQQQQVLEQQQQQAAASAGQDAKASTGAGAAPPPLPWDGDTALQQSVLVIVSDDRGFGQSIAKWLRKGGAGAVLVTTRSRAAWERPLLTALGSSGSQRRLDDVVIVSWDDVMASVGPKLVWGDNDDDAELGLGWGGDVGDDLFMSYTDDAYLWMVQEGFL